VPRKRVRKRKRTQSPGVGAGAARLVSDLRSYHATLASRRAALDQEITAVSDALSAMGGSGRSPGRPAASRGPARSAAKRRGSKAASPRAFRPGSLKDCIMKVLSRSNGPVAVKNIIPRVKTVGYKSKSKSLGNQVSMALREMPGVSRVGRGMYAAR